MLQKRPIMAAIVCSLGGLVFGYDLGALAAATQSLRTQFHLSPFLFGATISASLWGTVCGSILAGFIADRLGRRALIAGCALVYLLATLSAVLSLPANWSLFMAMRFLCGMAIGGFTVGCPLYLAEIAPPEIRGRIVALFQLEVGIGVVLAFTSGFLLTHEVSQSEYWRWCLGLGVVPAAILLSLLNFMQPTRHESSVAGGSSSGRERLFRRKYLRPLLLATSIALFNQLSGVNVLLIYLLDILSNAGLSHSLSHSYTVLISCLNLVTTLLGMACVDTLGRKTLIILGAAGMSLCLLGLGLTLPYHLGPMWYLGALVAYNGFFAFSQGTVVWVYLSELFPFGVRGAGQGYSSSVLWIANAVVIWSFPSFQKASPDRVFYLFSLMMILQVVVVLFWYPETRKTVLGS